MVLRRLHQFGGDPSFYVAFDGCLHFGDELVAVFTRGHGCKGIAEPCLGQEVHREARLQGFALRHHGIKLASLAVQHVRQNLRRRKVRAVVPGQTVGNDGESIGQIRLLLDRRGFQRPKMNRGSGRQGL